jgi:hypothetical protein
MSKILNQKGNANQNKIEIPLHPGQNGNFIKKTNNDKVRKQILHIIWGERNSYTLLVGM